MVLWTWISYNYKAFFCALIISFWWPTFALAQFCERPSEAGIFSSCFQEGAIASNDRLFFLSRTTTETILADLDSKGMDEEDTPYFSLKQILQHILDNELDLIVLKILEKSPVESKQDDCGFYLQFGENIEYINDFFPHAQLTEPQTCESLKLYFMVLLKDLRNEKFVNDWNGKTEPQYSTFENRRTNLANNLISLAEANYAMDFFGNNFDKPFDTTIVGMGEVPYSDLAKPILNSDNLATAYFNQNLEAMGMVAAAENRSTDWTLVGAGITKNPNYVAVWNNSQLINDNSNIYSSMLNNLSQKESWIMVSLSETGEVSSQWTDAAKADGMDVDLDSASSFITDYFSFERFLRDIGTSEIQVRRLWEASN